MLLTLIHRSELHLVISNTTQCLYEDLISSVGNALKLLTRLLSEWSIGISKDPLIEKEQCSICSADCVVSLVDCEPTGSKQEWI